MTVVTAAATGGIEAATAEIVVSSVGTTTVVATNSSTPSTRTRARLGPRARNRSRVRRSDNVEPQEAAAAKAEDGDWDDDKDDDVNDDVNEVDKD
ncbi:hypothetical protein SALBM311S_01736 [Streptomyces alboniger]